MLRAREESFWILDEMVGVKARCVLGHMPDTYWYMDSFCVSGRARVFQVIILTLSRPRMRRPDFDFTSLSHPMTDSSEAASWSNSSAKNRGGAQSSAVGADAYRCLTENVWSPSGENRTTDLGCFAGGACWPVFCPGEPELWTWHLVGMFQSAILWDRDVGSMARWRIERSQRSHTRFLWTSNLKAQHDAKFLLWTSCVLQISLNSELQRRAILCNFLWGKSAGRMEFGLPGSS